MISREARIFLVVGALTVAVDFGLYQLLLISLNERSVPVAKAGGFIGGTVFAYLVNKAWTFNQHTHAPGSAARFAGLYASTLLANVIVNTVVLELVGGSFLGRQVAFLLATAVSATLNFLGMKHFVFTHQSENPAP